MALYTVDKTNTLPSSYMPGMRVVYYTFVSFDAAMASLRSSIEELKQACKRCMMPYEILWRWLRERVSLEQQTSPVVPRVISWPGARPRSPRHKCPLRNLRWA